MTRNLQNLFKPYYMGEEFNFIQEIRMILRLIQGDIKIEFWQNKIIDGVKTKKIAKSTTINIKEKFYIAFSYKEEQMDVYARSWKENTPKNKIILKKIAENNNNFRYNKELTLMMWNLLPNNKGNIRRDPKILSELECFKDIEILSSIELINFYTKKLPEIIQNLKTKLLQKKLVEKDSYIDLTLLKMNKKLENQQEKLFLEWILKAIREDAIIAKIIPVNMLSNETYIFKAYKENENIIIENIKEELREKEDFLIKAIKLNRENIKYIPNKIKEDPLIMGRIIDICPSAINVLSDELKCSIDFVIKILENMRNKKGSSKHYEVSLMQQCIPGIGEKLNLDFNYNMDILEQLQVLKMKEVFNQKLKQEIPIKNIDVALKNKNKTKI